MKILKVSKKVKLGLCIISSTPLIFVNPAFGLDLNIDRFFKDVIGEVEEYAEIFKTEVEEDILASWEGIKADAQSAINSSLGDMGIPNTVKAGEQLMEEIGDKQTITQKIIRASELERLIFRQSVEAILSKKGQAKLLEGAYATEKVALTSKQNAQSNDSIAKESQVADSSQDVLKAISNQQAILSEQNSQIVWMLGKQRSDNVNERLARAQSNLMLGQIAEHQSSDSRGKRLQRNADTATVIELGTMLQLDVSRKY
ncbi:hypothetical protein NIES267_71240 (plasmid) [Calothrix parasitica NIES-267]|uniref:Uncharacterized protein n=1 Tax=Calothrix parasitica NIES-267 TaxID=1973488 RepID=A0A1Z4M2A0_9CYAN|nr:hypothetical protein NIES267_71240 [Calothrix parasitica NIES-267]